MNTFITHAGRQRCIFPAAPPAPAPASRAAAYPGNQLGLANGPWACNPQFILPSASIVAAFNQRQGRKQEATEPVSCHPIRLLSPCITNIVKGQDSSFYLHFKHSSKQYFPPYLLKKLMKLILLFPNRWTEYLIKSFTERPCLLLMNFTCFFKFPLSVQKNTKLYITRTEVFLSMLTKLYSAAPKRLRFHLPAITASLLTSCVWRGDFSTEEAKRPAMPSKTPRISDPQQHTDHHRDITLSTTRLPKMHIPRKPGVSIFVYLFKESWFFFFFLVAF